MPSYIGVCERAARAGGEALGQWAGRFSVRIKGPADLVTEADLASQDAVRQVVLGAFPQHGFLGEEGADVAGAGDYRWIVDPLDGTTNFVHGAPLYAVSVALESGGEILAAAVYNPVSDECFTAALGQGAYLNGSALRVSQVRKLSEALVAVSFPAVVPRGAPEIAAFIEVLHQAQAFRRIGSAALNLSYLAAGRFDACWATDNKAWDVAAGFLLVREAGGVVTNLAGGPVNLVQPRYLASATPALHAELLPLLTALA